MTESPQHVIIRREGDIEVRQYAPYVVAEVDVEAPDPIEAAQRGFRPLADYIFGNNLPKQEIAMTAPVTAEAKGEKIAMTSPVTSSASADGVYTVRFSMPSKWTLDTLPQPGNDRVRLVPVESELVLAITFRGRNDPKKLDAAGRSLTTFAAENGLTPIGDPTWAGYSAPTFPFPFASGKSYWGSARASRRECTSIGSCSRICPLRLTAAVGDQLVLDRCVLVDVDGLVEDSRAPNRVAEGHQELQRLLR